MRPLLAISMIAAFAACGPADTESADDADTPLADFAGTWDNVVTLEETEEPVQSQTVVEPDGTGWTMLLEGRDPITLTATIQGDSVITESDSFESILRPGVTTRVRTAAVMDDATMTGNVVVTYEEEGAEAQVLGTLRATRSP
jgi:hypothetical protein